MWTMNRSVKFAGACTCLFAAALAGCTKDIWIVQYPAFYQKGQIESIAVMPFRCPAAPRSTGGIIIADGLAAALMNNGTYQRVYNRSDLRALLAEHDLKDLFSDTPTTKGLAALRKATDAQAIIVGSVSTYSATTRNEPKQMPIYGTDANGNLIIIGYNRYVLTRNEANVSATAALLRVSDGSTIYAVPAPAAGHMWAQGSPPQYDPNACLSFAVNQVVRQMLERFAVVRRKIKVDPNKALRTASELYDNKWVWKDTFKADEEKMFVVVKLPASCDRNRFRLVVVRKDTREELAAMDIEWTKKYGAYGYGFSPKSIAQAAGGPGEFTIKFYSGPEPVMTRNFRIVH